MFAAYGWKRYINMFVMCGKQSYFGHHRCCQSVWGDAQQGLVSTILLRYIYPFHQKTERSIPVTINCTGCEPPVYSMGTEHDSMGTSCMENRGSWFEGKDTVTDRWVLWVLLFFWGYWELLLLYNLVRGIKPFTCSGSCLRRWIISFCFQNL